MTKISWTDESWNPVTGCTPVSEGCAHCYAKRDSKRWGRSFDVTLHPDRLDIPLRWRKPRMVFTPSMGDLFHDDVPDEFIDRVFAVMALTPRHTYQALTKRSERMRHYLADTETVARIDVSSAAIVEGRILTQGSIQGFVASVNGDPGYSPVWPLPNVWLGVSVENQARADERIPLLLDTPAAVRFVSAEPLLGPLDLTPWVYEQDPIMVRVHGPRGKLDWVIVGGESGGPPERRLVERCEHWRMDIGVSDRPCYGTGWHPKRKALGWVRAIRNQCQAAGVPFFLKQLGPRAGQGTMLDGREWREMPDG